MISDGYVKVTCDKCEESEEVEMTPLAGGGYDTRNISNWLRRNNYEVVGKYIICPDCRDEEEDKDNGR